MDFEHAEIRSDHLLLAARLAELDAMDEFAQRKADVRIRHGRWTNAIDVMLNQYLARSTAPDASEFRETFELGMARDLRRVTIKK